MKVRIVRTHQLAPEIRQGSVRRDWMDATYNKHAYRCLPLTEANTGGWEVILQQDLVVIWDGGNSVPRIISGDVYDTRTIANCNKIGMVDFHVGWSVMPPEGYDVWLSGPPNYFVDGAVPLTANIPFWWPDEESFVWKITKVGEPVVFPKGMPFVFFQIYDRSTMPGIEFEVHNLWDNQELSDQRMAYSTAKINKLRAEPWSWMNGIRTGLNEKGERIGPEFKGHPTLMEPK